MVDGVHGGYQSVVLVRPPDDPWYAQQEEVVEERQSLVYYMQVERRTGFVQTMRPRLLEDCVLAALWTSR